MRLTYRLTTDLEMKTIVTLTLLLLLGTGCEKNATKPGATFYLQLVRGADPGAQSEPGWRPVGPQLKGKLQSVFRWKHYWEIARASVLVQGGQRVRRLMCPGREVEIQLLDPQNMAVRIYRDGKLARSREQPVTGAFCVVGGDEGRDQSWFIIVRRDKPPDVL